MPRACVHEVPNGAEISNDADGGATVRINGKVVATYPPCPCSWAGLNVDPERPPQVDSGASDATTDEARDAREGGTDGVDDGPSYCSARGPLTKAEAADAGDLIPCPANGACVQFVGGGQALLPDGAPAPKAAGWACVIETGCSSSGGDAGVHCVD